MDKIQFQIACEIIALGCTEQNQLKDKQGNFCALGGLYAAIDPDWAVSTEFETFSKQRLHYKEIEEIYGIDVDLVFTANDNTPNLIARRIAVKTALAGQLEDE